MFSAATLTSLRWRAVFAVRGVWVVLAVIGCLAACGQVSDQTASADEPVTSGVVARVETTTAPVASTTSALSTTTVPVAPVGSTTTLLETSPLVPVHTFVETTLAPPTTERGDEPTTTTTEPPVPGPAGLMASIQRALDDPGFDATQVGLQIWVDGYGPAITNDADVALHPASMQKLATSLVALEVFGPDHTFDTVVMTDRPVDGTTIHGDLYVVAGADPVLTQFGPHSIGELGRTVRAAGVETIHGLVVIDESRHPIAPTVPGWESRYVPLSIGPLSAMVVEGNKPPTVEPDYFLDPQRENARLIGDALRNAGIDVGERVALRAAPDDAIEVARLASPPVSELVAAMLGPSDNTTSELIVREIGLARRGNATTEAGLAVIDETLTELLGPLSGVSADGSGLHLGNRRSAAEWWRLLAHVSESEWADVFTDGLALGGESGTLRRRFRETPADGLVRAKTGTINGVRTLGGYVTTLDGRQAIFVLIANGDADRRTTLGLDAIVDRIAGHPG